MKPPVSNFPYSDDPNEDLCDGFRADHDVSMNSQTYYEWPFVRPILIVRFQLVFTMTNYMIDKSVVPPYVPNGLMRIEVTMELNDTIVSGVSIYIRTENESDL